MLRRRFTLANVLAVLAIAELLVLAFLTSGLQGTARLGPFRIAVYGFDNPFRIGLGLSAWILIQKWRSRPWRRFGFLLIVGFVALAVTYTVQNAPPFKPPGDIAVDELYVLLTVKRELLVGPYSRFQWHHPGPLYFLMQAPVYALSGYRSAGLYGGAVVLNLLTLGTLVWVTAREDRGVLAICVTLASLWFTWRLVGLLASPWTAHIPILSSLTFIVVAAAVASGRTRLTPLLILLGSFIVQTHIAFGPLVLVLIPAALTSLLYWCWRDKRGAPWPVINTSAWLLALLWLLPIVEQISGNPGNVTRLWQFFVVTGRVSQPFGASLAYWSNALAGILQPVLRLPWGVKAEPATMSWTALTAVASVLLLPLAAVAALRAGRRFEASLAAMAFAASLVGLWSTHQIRDDILQHDVLWLTGLGALNLAVVTAAGIRAARDRWLPGWTDSGRATTPTPVLVAATCTLALLLTVTMSLRDFHKLVDYEATRAGVIRVVTEADRSIRRYVASERINRPVFEINADWGIAASTFVELEKAGTPFAVQDAWLFMFTGVYARTGREDAVVSLDRFKMHNELRARPGNVVLLENDMMNLDALRLDPGR